MNPDVARSFAAIIDVTNDYIATMPKGTKQCVVNDLSRHMRIVEAALTPEPAPADDVPVQE